VSQSPVVFQEASSDGEGAMTTLRQKLIDELELRGLSRSTQESYVGIVSMLARHYWRSPDRINDEELRG
jgi:integrase/recombinase XerD